MTLKGKKIRSLLLVTLLISRLSFSFGAPHLPDSLRDQYMAASDSEKVFLLSSLSLHTLTSSLTRSLEYATTARYIADSLGHPILQAQAYNRLGTVYIFYNHYQNALKYLTNALKIRLEINDSIGISQSYVNLGVLYQRLGNLDKAIEYTQRSLEIREKLQITKHQGTNLNNLVVFYIQKKETAMALQLGQKALDFFRKKNDKFGMSDIYVNLGELYSSLDDTDKAISYYNKAKQYAVALKDVSRIVNINHSLITALLDQGNTDEAYPLITETIPLAQQYGELEGLTLLYEQVTRFYELKKDYARANYFLEKYETIKDSLQVSQQKEKIIQQQAKFDAELTDQQLRTIKQRYALEKMKSEKDKYFVFRVVILIFFLTILGAVLFGLLRSIKTTIEALKHQNHKLSETNLKLQHSEENLQEIIRSKDKFFSIIAHDIINPFQPLLGLSELLIKDIDRLNDNEIKKYSGLIHQSASRIFNLLNNLLQWTRSQTDKLSYKPVSIPVQGTVEEELNNFQELAKQKKVTIHTDINKDLKAFGDMDLFRSVIRNLVNNAIKFNLVKGTIFISAQQIDQEIRVTIRDTGVGISRERIDRLFSIETITSTRGTMNEEGTGLGLLLCKEFVEKNSGNISAESTPGKGTAFMFTIPANPPIKNA